MRQKVSLREFQEYLAQRLAVAARGDGSAALLGVQFGSDNWLLELGDSGEVVPLHHPLTPVPTTRPWFSGLANIRGALYAVSDFSAFCGGEPAAQNVNTRLVLVGTRFGINAAVLANKMLGLKNPSGFVPVALPDNAPPWQQSLLRDQAGQLWKKLDVSALLASAAFMDISA